MGEDSAESDGDSETVSVGDLFTLHSSGVRRSVLFDLRQHSVPTIDELVDVVVAVEEHGSAAVGRGAVFTGLVHAHLPNLQAAGFLTYESDDRIVESTAKGSEQVATEAIAAGVTDDVQKGPATDRYDELVDRIRRAVR